MGAQRHLDSIADQLQGLGNDITTVGFLESCLFPEYTQYDLEGAGNNLTFTA